MDDNTRTYAIHPETYKDLVKEGLFKDVIKPDYTDAEDFTTPPEYEYSTYAEQDNSDVVYVPHVGPLPKYYTTDQKTGAVTAITRTEYGKLRKEQITHKYKRLPDCGHKFVPGAYPRHRNCENCLFAFFQINGELSQSIEELYAKHGSTPVIRLLGKKVYHNWRKFMATVALLKKAQEAQGEVNGSTTGTESSSETTVAEVFGEGTFDARSDPEGGIFLKDGTYIKEA